MDKKKLIGTIIGVTLFVILVAGATYAWLTFSATITNGNYSYGTKNFAVIYENETPTLSGDLPSLTTATATTATSMKVAAHRELGTPNGILYLKVSSTAEDINNMTKGGAVKYAVCSGSATASDCDGNLIDGATGVLATGTVIATADKLETIMYQTVDPDLTEEQKESLGLTGKPVGIPTTKTYYWIYFWMNPANLTNEMVGETYKGYVHASAEQR